MNVIILMNIILIIFLGNRGHNENESYSVEDKRLSLAYEKIEAFPRTLLDQFSYTIQILDISHNEFQ